nr:retrovirus-related Pol polyprotein from transposon TNT 1-94 [Tanacetum cinerariifolium]
MDFASNKPLYLLHMDLCGPMRVESINEKRYVLVVVDDYSRYTWVLFLHSNNEASEVIISFIKKTQVNLQLQVQRVRTDNGTEFKNKTLAKFFDEVGISPQFSAARTPQQNGVVEKRNRTLVEATRTMLTFANLALFLWAKAIATACFTQNRSIIHKRFDKTPYEIMNKRKPNIKFFVCSDVDVIFLMTMSMLEISRQRGILECLLDIQKSLLLSEFTTNELIMKSSTTNVETSTVEIPSHEEEVFHESFESFQEESSLSSLNDEVQQNSNTSMAFGGNTRDLGLFREETDEITTIHQSQRRKGHTDLGDGITIICDGVRSSKRWRENPILALGDYSRPSHGGYRNTIELLDGNNMVPLRSHTIRLVQKGCSFHELWSEDPNQHLKDFLKLVDLLDLNVANRERTRTINQSAGGKLCDKNAKESWALLEDLALYDNESWNDPRDFAKPVKKKIDWNRPPKEGDGTWHIRIELIDPDEEKFKKTLQSIPTTRKLHERENSSEIIDFDHLHDF